jgi:hypothetical protein
VRAFSQEISGPRDVLRRHRNRSRLRDRRQRISSRRSVERLGGHVEAVLGPDDGAVFHGDFGEAVRVAQRIERCPLAHRPKRPPRELTAADRAVERNRSQVLPVLGVEVGTLMRRRVAVEEADPGGIFATGRWPRIGNVPLRGTLERARRDSNSRPSVP